MADVERKAEAEAQKKGLSGQAEKNYVGGVFNRIRAAHDRATTPGKGKRHLNRAARREARKDAMEQIRYHQAQIKGIREGYHQRVQMDEPRERPKRPSVAKKSPFTRMQEKAHPNAGEIAREVATPQTAEDAYRYLRHDPYFTDEIDKHAGGYVLHGVDKRDIEHSQTLSPQELLDYARAHARDAQKAPRLHARVSQAEFDRGLQDAIQQTANGSGFTTIEQLRRALKKRFGMTPAEVDAHLRDARERGDRQQAPYELHFEPDEDKLYKHNRPLQWRGENFDYITAMRPQAEVEAGPRARMEREGRTPPQQIAREVAARNPQNAPPAPPAPQRAKLVPIKEIPGYRLDAARKLDPYFIREYYGDAQLPTALDIQTPANLREAIEVVEEHTGRKFSGSRSKRNMIAWIRANMDAR